MGQTCKTNTQKLNDCQQHKQEFIGICVNLKCSKKDRRVCKLCMESRSDCKHKIDIKFNLVDNSDLLILLHGYTLTLAFQQQRDNLIANLRQQLQYAINYMIQPLIENCENEFIDKYPEPIKQYLLDGAQQVIEIGDKLNFNSTTDHGFKLICLSSDQVLNQFQIVNLNEYQKIIITNQIQNVITKKSEYIKQKTMTMQMITNQKRDQAIKDTFINLSTIKYELPIYELKKKIRDENFGICEIHKMAIVAYCQKCSNKLCQNCIKQHECLENERIILDNFKNKYQKLIKCCEKFISFRQKFGQIKELLNEFLENTIKQIDQSIKASLTKIYTGFKGIELDLTYEAVKQIFDLYNNNSFNQCYLDNLNQQNVVITLVKNQDGQLISKLKIVLNELTQYSLNFHTQLKQISKEILKDFVKNTKIEGVTKSLNRQTDQVSQINLVLWNKLISTNPQEIPEESNSQISIDNYNTSKKTDPDKIQVNPQDISKQDEKLAQEHEEAKMRQKDLEDNKIKDQKLAKELEEAKIKQEIQDQIHREEQIRQVKKQTETVAKTIQIEPIQKQPEQQSNKQIDRVQDLIDSRNRYKLENSIQRVIKLRSDIHRASQKRLIQRQNQIVTSLIEYDSKIFCSYNDGQIIEFSSPNYVADQWDIINCGTMGSLYCYQQVDSDYLVVYIGENDQHYISIYELRNRLFVTKMKAHEKKIMAIKKFNVDSYASLSIDKTIKIWSQKTHECTFHYTEHTGPVRDFAVVNELQFISLSLGELLHIDHDKNNIIQKATSNQPFYCLQIFQSFLLVGLKDGKIEIRLPNQINQVQNSFQIFDDGLISFIQILGSYVLMSGLDKTIKVLEMNTKQITNLLEKYTNERAEVILVIQGKIIFGDDCDLKYIEY